MQPLPALATPDDLATLQMDVVEVAPYLAAASARVRGHVQGRTSAVGLFAATTPANEALVQLVCTIAQRVQQATATGLSQGVRRETVGTETIEYGADAASAVSGLTKTEQQALDRLFPRRGSTIYTDPE